MKQAQIVLELLGMHIGTLHIKQLGGMTTNRFHRQLVHHQADELTEGLALVALEFLQPVGAGFLEHLLDTGPHCFVGLVKGQAEAGALDQATEFATDNHESIEAKLQECVSGHLRRH